MVRKMTYDNAGHQTQHVSKSLLTMPSSFASTVLSKASPTTVGRTTYQPIPFFLAAMIGPPSFSMQKETKVPKESKDLQGLQTRNAWKDRMTIALELASDFLPERKWCRELNKKSCNIFDVLTRVTLWNNKATEVENRRFVDEVGTRFFRGCRGV